MPARDRRNILHIGPPPEGMSKAAITEAMVEVVSRRIEAVGGTLAFWGVMNEDSYETFFGDGFYLHLYGLALTREDADRLMALAPPAQYTKWHIREYRIGLEDGRPTLVSGLGREDEFTINDVVELLCEIPPGGTTSRLRTGEGWQGRKAGPHMLELPQQER